MENKKGLQINANVCDARQVTEEALAAYAWVKINCATLLTNAAVRTLMARYNVKLNAAQTLDVQGDAHVQSINGVAKIAPGQPLEGNLFLTVNGVLDIAPGCEEQLKSISGLSVNGKIVCPESLSGLLGGISINGKLEVYPDESIRLKSTAVLDRTFVLRAKQDALYYAAGRIVALDPTIDFARLAEKNVRFQTGTLLVAESLVEAAVPLFDESASIVVLPDGCAFVNDDAVLDQALLRRYGGRLYVNGDLTVPAGSAACLEQITFLQVKGDISTVRALRDAVAALDAEYDALKVIGGTHIQDRGSLTVSRADLEQAEDGYSVANCATVTFREDVEPRLIREKVVSISDCAAVYCTDEQRAALEPLCSDVASLGAAEEPEEDEEEPEDCSSINGNYYVF